MRRIRRRQAMLVSIACVAVSGVLLGSAAAQQSHGVDVRDNSFAPENITVTAGDTVVWTQSGSNPHSVTADDGSFDSHPNCGVNCMQQGETFEHTFETPGEYPYYCRLHGSSGGAGMAAVVVVETAQQPQQPAPTPAAQPAPGVTAQDPAAQPAPAGTDVLAEGAAAADDSDLPTTGGVPLLALALMASPIALILGPLTRTAVRNTVPRGR